MVKNWYCIKLPDGKEEKTISRALFMLTQVGFDTSKTMFKIPKDSDKNALYSGYGFIRCALTPELFEIIKNLPVYLSFLDKKRVDKKKKKAKKKDEKEIKSIVHPLTEWPDAIIKRIEETGIETIEKVKELDLVPDRLYKIERGSFKGFNCIFKKVTGMDKVLVTLSIFGRPMELEIDIDDLYDEVIL